MAKPARKLDDVVQDIVKTLDNGDEFATEVSVRSAIGLLRTLYPPSPKSSKRQPLPLWGFRQENLEQIKSLRTQVEKLQKALTKVPDRALALLFAPEEDGLENRIPSATTQRQLVKRTRAVVNTLAFIRGRCDQMISTKPGMHKSAQALQQHVVKEASDHFSTSQAGNQQ